MNHGIHGSDFCLTGFVKVKEYPCIKQTGTIVATRTSRPASLRKSDEPNIYNSNIRHPALETDMPQM
jgi:hypothetical protein